MTAPTQTNKRELTVFFIIAFAVPYLMGIPLAIAQRMGHDTSCFANAQMMYPAAGVMLAYFTAKRRGLPVRFFVLHLLATILCVAASLFSVAFPSDTLWLLMINIILVAGSLLAWIFLLTDKKEKRTNYGLRWRGKGVRALGVCVLFLFLKTAIIFVSVALEGAKAWNDYLAYWASFVPWMYAALLIPNFFLSFLPYSRRYASSRLISRVSVPPRLLSMRSPVCPEIRNLRPPAHAIKKSSRNDCFFSWI